MFVGVIATVALALFAANDLAKYAHSIAVTAVGEDS